MREVVMRVPADAIEDVLDRLLPLLPAGVRERRDGARVALVMRGAELPSAQQLAELAQGWSYELEEREISDDWRERRLADYEAEPIAGRLVVRPQWAPPPAAERGLIDLVLSASTAFGAGTHPTTRTCLELMLEAELSPGTSFADLGCGSGVLAILAAKLGCRPVCAFDIQAASVAAALANATLNGVELDARVVDVTAERAAAVDALAANVPPAVHQQIAAGLSEPGPSFALVSGFGPSAADEVFGAYGSCGLRERRRVERNGWIIGVLTPR